MQLAAQSANKSKIQFRNELKAEQRRREQEARNRGEPMSARDKERERSRRESSVTRRRAEVYVEELEKTARKLPKVESEVLKMRREVELLQGALSSSSGGGTAGKKMINKEDDNDNDNEQQQHRTNNIGMLSDVGNTVVGHEGNSGVVGRNESSSSGMMVDASQHSNEGNVVKAEDVHVQVHAAQAQHLQQHGDSNGGGSGANRKPGGGGGGGGSGSGGMRHVEM